MRNKSMLKMGGFSLIELLVVVAVIAIMMSLLLPALGKSRDYAKQSSCASNLRQIGVMMFSYLTDSGEYFPAKGSGSLCWVWLLHETYDAANPNWPVAAGKRPVGVWACPASRNTLSPTSLYPSDYGKNPDTGISSDGGACNNYGKNVWRKLGETRSPSKAFFAVDSDYYGAEDYTGRDVFAYLGFTASPGGVGPRHAKRASMQFIDGHVSFINPYDPAELPTPVTGFSAGSAGNYLPWNIKASQ